MTDRVARLLGVAQQSELWAPCLIIWIIPETDGLYGLFILHEDNGNPPPRYTGLGGSGFLFSAAQKENDVVGPGLIC